jgi:hypothetical protein
MLTFISDDTFEFHKKLQKDHDLSKAALKKYFLCTMVNIKSFVSNVFFQINLHNDTTVDFKGIHEIRFFTFNEFCFFISVHVGRLAVESVLDRVTRLGDFSPIGSFFTLGSFLLQ